jgi:nucleoside-triphosphatase THEP1
LSNDTQHTDSLSLRGQRAALLGSLWAANEIVLGSFLHNVSFPFTGILLASIGVSLLVAGVRIWNDRGVIWRAGLVCALMKSISPSAVILMPMIGIVAEAVTVWLIVLALGRNPMACLIGGFLATMVPMFQQVVNIIIAYGLNAARIYAAVYTFAASWFGVESISPVGAITIVALVSGIPGALAAGLGLAVARRVYELPPPDREQTTSDMLPTLDRLAAGQQYSFSLLFLHGVVIALVLTLAARIELEAQLILVAFYVAVVFIRYPSLRRRFAHPGMWLQFAVVAALAGFVFGSLGPMGSWWNGVRSGLLMAVRALFVVTAFGGVSVELRNPRLVNWLLRRGLGSLGNALDAAFRSLPTMVAALAEHRSLMRNPVNAVSRMMAVVIRELNEHVNHRPHTGPRVFILTGAQGSGKTSLLERLVPLVRQRGHTVAGIRAPLVMHAGARIGYNVEDIKTGDTLPLCRIGQRNAVETAGPFGFDRTGIRFGARALALEAVAQRDIVVVDEIGPLELRGGGWAPVVRPLLESYGGSLLLVIRPDILQAVLGRWQINPVSVWDPDVHSVETIVEQLVG